MYRIGQEVLDRGLSRPASIVLGLVAGLTSAATTVMAPSSNRPAAFYLFALFCAAIAVASLFTGKVRSLAARSLGAAVFVFASYYFASQLLEGTFVSASPSQPSILNAAIFLAIAGIPGLRFALLGRFSKRRAQATGDES
ncbi:hypothetical protein [Pseudoxanthomonas winnipegensis]|uniref:Uncharacterized protein n=1 Tax=Pseudoxanthomonas winnipegensis TaxID=2480810 RepID=A0A4Q8M5W4_9GAMM|nr:hypothetical protein [Pseudoxanthomonas winnipegensis]TAA43455.1 hypothetical protein EA655_09305 [Pseudoxanthomonas winnipegensis]